MENNSNIIREKAESVLGGAASISERSDDIFKLLEVLNEKTRKINEVTKTIQSIANKTNILSLNASIESARAGEYGRGFSVVAKQMQQLAGTSKSSSMEIFSLLKELSTATEEITARLDELSREAEKQKEASEVLLNTLDNE